MKSVFRSLSSKASIAASHEPPKKIPGSHGRYAGAMFTAASKAGMLEKVETELLSITNVISKDKGFSTFLSNPTVPRAEKQTKLGNLLEDGKFSHLTKNLIITMSANGRVGEIGKVVDAFADFMDTSRGIVKVRIVSAEPLNKKSLDAIQAAVISMAGVEKKATLEVAVDSTILGGLQVQIGENFLDLSVASRVNKLSAALDGAL
jgi:F-type H+-transporting ATPase subunit O